MVLHSLLKPTIRLGLLYFLLVRICALLLLAKVAQTAGIWHGFALSIAMWGVVRILMSLVFGNMAVVEGSRRST